MQAPLLQLVRGGRFEASPARLHIVAAGVGHEPRFLELCAGAEKRKLTHLERSVACAVDITSKGDVAAALQRVVDGESLWVRVYACTPQEAVAHFLAMAADEAPTLDVGERIGTVAGLSFKERSPGRLQATLSIHQR